MSSAAHPGILVSFRSLYARGSPRCSHSCSGHSKVLKRTRQVRQKERRSACCGQKIEQACGPMHCREGRQSWKTRRRTTQQRTDVQNADTKGRTEATARHAVLNVFCLCLCLGRNREQKRLSASWNVHGVDE